jgi:hypothetical protein
MLDLVITVLTIQSAAYAGVFLLKKDPLGWFGIRRSSRPPGMR